MERYKGMGLATKDKIRGRGKLKTLYIYARNEEEKSTREKTGKYLKN